MSDKKQKSRKRAANISSKGLTALIIKQIIAAGICFIILIGMKNSSNPKVKGYAEALGRAMRYDAKWEMRVKDAFSQIKENLSAEDSSQPADTEEASFQ